MRSNPSRIGWLGAALALSLALLLSLQAGTAVASVESELAFHRGVVAYGEGRLADARQHFETVLAADPEDTVVLHYLGLIAQREGDPMRAIEFYDRALAVDPADTDVKLDRAIALLDGRRLAEARAAFDEVLASDPSQARAQLFAGIAAYRAGAFADAKPYLARAGELDASLRDEARYYTGLCDALLGNMAQAEVAFADVEQEAPLSPLAQSAQNLRQQVAPPPERRWFAAMTAGMEWDDNPQISGTNAFGVPVDTADSDWRGVVRPRFSFRFLQGDNYSATGGYDGYLSFHIDEKQVDLGTHSAWIGGGYNIGMVRLGLRTDYAYTMRDLTEPFRHLIRTTPSVSVRPADWALTYLFYQYHWKDFLLKETGGTTLDRDGFRNVFGLNQYFFMPAPFTYVRIGAYGDFNNTEGNEWDYDGMETNFGVGYDFPYDVSLTWLWRFLYRAYENPSLFSSPEPFTQTRTDYRHVFTVELAKGITEHIEASVGGAFTWNDSNVDFYDYSRHIAGAYVTYRF